MSNSFLYCSAQAEIKFQSIQGAVMFGREHDQAGILIESRGVDAIDVNDDIQIANFRNKIWYRPNLFLF